MTSERYKSNDMQGLKDEKLQLKKIMEGLWNWCI